MASATGKAAAAKKIYYEGWLDKKSPAGNIHHSFIIPDTITYPTIPYLTHRDIYFIGIRGFRKWQKRWFQIQEKAIV